MKSTDFLKEDDMSWHEYNDEASMVKNNLITLIRMALELAKDIDDEENIPEWCQEKIAQAKGMIVNVGDYMISQHQMGVRPPQQMSEMSAGATGSAGVATAMGDGAGFGKSIFMRRQPTAKKKKK